MSDQPSREHRADETASGSAPASGSAAGSAPASGSAAGSAPASGSAANVDADLKRRLEEAYLNDEEDVLVVSAVRSTANGDEVVVELRPPHGDASHTERFSAPKHGSLEECADLLRFLEAAGVSPLDLDELVGTRVPAAFDPETGWRLDPAYVSPEVEPDPSIRSRLGGAWRDTTAWLRTYRKWLLVILLVGVELLLVVVLILIFA